MEQDGQAFALAFDEICGPCGVCFLLFPRFVDICDFAVYLVALRRPGTVLDIHLSQTLDKILCAALHHETIEERRVIGRLPKAVDVQYL